MEKIDPASVNPMHNCVLIEVQMGLIKDKSDGGIIIPDGELAKRKGGTQIAKVLKIGPEAFANYTEEMGAPKVGDSIVTQRYPGFALDLDPGQSDADANRYRIISDDEVRGVL